MERFTGIIGILLILGIAFLFSNNKRRIDRRLVLSGLVLQIGIALLVLKVPAFNQFFQGMGRAMQKLESFAREGVAFVYGGLAAIDANGNAVNYGIAHVFVFAFNITATVTLLCVLVAILYHLRVMQFIVSMVARVMHVVMRVSGAEALSNAASAFVGQVEAQVMIRAYLPTMTASELLASMSGSLACISGSILVVYANMGVRADHLIAASLMAAPGALVISKIVFPETEASPTMGTVKLDVKSGYTNLVDAITHGAADGFKISMNMIAMLIAFIALIAMVNWGLHHISPGLSLDTIFGTLFYPMAWAMGIPTADVHNAATLLGQKLTINEFVAFRSLTNGTVPIITQKGLTVVSIAICGFANFSSVGMQIGGIGSIAPERRTDLAKLGLKALLCGTLASYLSACIAGILQ
ncbi:nucleoside transporter [Nemorincola caseinilytica]|uniref:Nucleoside transporter n=1 Tax=Nemorincola caseinilytica TaxID=2054315 RepID=A0ABP8NMJ7_9BACT